MTKLRFITLFFLIFLLSSNSPNKTLRPVSRGHDTNQFDAPMITTDSSTISVSLYGCNDSLIVPFTIFNHGDSELSYHFSNSSLNGDDLPLDSVRVRLNNAFEQITNLLPNFFEFQEGETGMQISDGGNDMYDGGNYLSFNNNFNFLEYSNDLVISNANLGDGGQYFTKKYPGLFVLAADINNVSSFDISGDLGADGSGFVSGTTLTYSTNGNTYSGFVKKVYGAFDPSIHHLIIVKNETGLTHSYENQTFNDTHQVGGLENVDRIYYLLFSEAAGDEYSTDQIEAVMIRFLEIVESPTFVDLPTGDFTLGPNQAETIQLLFTSTGRNGGIYQQNIIIHSNDPLQSTLAIPTSLTIFGEPEITLSDTCLHFPATMQFTSSSQILVLSNPGCDTLKITDVQVNDPVFSLSFNQATIEPQKADTLIVNFNPVIAGNYNAAISFNNNDTTATLCLTASSFDAPLIQTSPESLSIDLFSCADTVVVPITILNNGAGTLEYQFSGINSEDGNIPLDSVRARITESFAELTELLPDLFFFEEGETGNSIWDGGGDMYDGGNFLNINSSFNLAYSDDLITEFDYLDSDGQYFTKKFPGLFIFSADLNGVSSFNIAGDLGADGGGLVAAAEILLVQNGVPYKGFVKKVYNAFDPSVNHLVIVKNPVGVSHTYDPTSQLDEHNINNLQNVSRIYYLLFAGTNGLFYTDEQFREIMFKFLEIVEDYGFATLPEETFTLGPNNSETLQIPFTSLNAIGGTYEQKIVIQSNDPLQPNLELPVTINISFDLCANFEFDQPIECGGQVNFISTTVNTPTSYLWIFGDGNISTEANPTHVYTMPGTYQVQLSVTNSTSSDFISRQVQIDETNAPVEACPVLGPNNFPYAEITSFSLNTIDNFSGSNNSSYSDYTCDFSTNLTEGVVYEVNIISEYGGEQNIRIWIDLNNSGTFESDELLYSADNATSPHMASITIPNTSTAIGLPLRCRVATDDIFYSLSACAPSNIGEFEDYTVIIEANTLPPVANFELEVLDQCQGTVQFTDLSTNFPTAWSWDFGDGSTSSAQNPFHIYNEAGIYTVTLVGANAFGEDEYSFNVTINSLNPAIEILSPLQVNTPISFAANAIGGISWLWDFGDGNTASSAMPMHTYEEVGEYFVTLTVSNGFGCQRTVSTTVNVLLTGVVQEERSFLIFPNPSIGDFLISNKSGLPWESIQVFNLAGQLVHQNPAVPNSEEPYPLSLHHLANGTYLIKIRFDETREYLNKLIIQR